LWNKQDFFVQLKTQDRAKFEYTECTTGWFRPAHIWVFNVLMLMNLLKFWESVLHEEWWWWKWISVACLSKSDAGTMPTMLPNGLVN
jgi:hypothetical protein